MQEFTNTALRRLNAGVKVSVARALSERMSSGFLCNTRLCHRKVFDLLRFNATRTRARLINSWPKKPSRFTTPTKKSKKTCKNNLHAEKYVLT